MTCAVGGVGVGQRNQRRGLAVEVDAQRAAARGVGGGTSARRGQRSRRAAAARRSRRRDPASRPVFVAGRRRFLSDGSRAARQSDRREQRADGESAALARPKTPVLFRVTRIARRRAVHEATPVRISPDGAVGIGAARAGGLRLLTAQGQALPPIKVDLPPPPNFNVQNAPEQYPTGEMSVYGLAQAHEPVPGQGRPGPRVPAADLRVPRRAAEVQRRAGGEVEEGKEEGAEVRRPAGQGGAPPAGDADEGWLSPLRSAALLRGRHADHQAGSRAAGRRLPDQGLEHRQAEGAGGQGGRRRYIVTGTFAINSIGGFAASDGLIIHKKLRTRPAR